MPPSTRSPPISAPAKGNVFRANGSTIAKPGFMQVYLEGTDDAKPGDDDEKMLPPLAEGEKIALTKIRPEQHFTEPPPRYSEASLVKTLEEHGIGRPSTYASIISTLQDREYVEMDKKRFIPTDVGRVVNKFLTNYFTQYVDYDFTARLEDELDAVSRGEEEWVPLLEKFWQPFKDRIDHTQENVQRSDVTQEKIDEKCPKCDGQLAKRLGRNGELHRLHQLPGVRLHAQPERRRQRRRQSRRRSDATARSAALSWSSNRAATASSSAARVTPSAASSSRWRNPRTPASPAQAATRVG